MKKIITINEQSMDLASEKFRNIFDNIQDKETVVIFENCKLSNNVFNTYMEKIEVEKIIFNNCIMNSLRIINFASICTPEVEINSCKFVQGIFAFHYDGYFSLNGETKRETPITITVKNCTFQNVTISQNLGVLEYQNSKATFIFENNKYINCNFEIGIVEAIEVLFQNNNKLINCDFSFYNNTNQKAQYELLLKLGFYKEVEVEKEIPLYLTRHYDDICRLDYHKNTMKLIYNTTYNRDEDKSYRVLLNEEGGEFTLLNTPLNLCNKSFKGIEKMLKQHNFYDISTFKNSLRPCYAYKVFLSLEDFLRCYHAEYVYSHTY